MKIKFFISRKVQIQNILHGIMLLMSVEMISDWFVLFNLNFNDKKILFSLTLSFQKKEETNKNATN